MTAIPWEARVDLRSLGLNSRDPSQWKTTRDDILHILQRELRHRSDGELKMILSRFEKAQDSSVCLMWWNRFYDWADLNYTRVLA
jgi:hypothetical protein